VASREEIEAVSDFARERGLLLISDEIYDSFVYDGELARPKEFHEGTMVLGGFSKNLGIPGWRMGFALGPKALIEQMRILQQFSFVCAPTPAQWGVLAGLDVDFSGHLADYRRKRDFIFGALKDRFEVVKPGGAFYIFPKLPHGVSDDAFVARCIERNLLVVPGSACCSRKDYLRVSFAASDEDLRRGAEILNAVADSFRP
jgi:aspartate aminotransferase/aminotransferase